MSLCLILLQFPPSQMLTLRLHPNKCSANSFTQSGYQGTHPGMPRVLTSLTLPLPPAFLYSVPLPRSPPPSPFSLLLSTHRTASYFCFFSNSFNQNLGAWDVTTFQRLWLRSFGHDHGGIGSWHPTQTPIPSPHTHSTVTGLNDQ